MDKVILASARALVSQWAHLGYAGCEDQCTLHLESEFPDAIHNAELECALTEEWPLPTPIFA